MFKKPFQSKDRFGGKPAGRSFGGRTGEWHQNPRQGGFKRDFADKPLFKTTCDKCNAPCEVPFRPNGSKPVYCNNCFGGGMGKVEHRSYDRDRAPRRESYDRPSREDDTGDRLKAIEAKLDEILKRLNQNV